VIGVVKQMNGTVEPVFIVVLMGRDEAYGPLQRTKALVILATVLLIALSAGGIGWVWRQQILHSYRQQLNAELERRALIGHYDYLTRYANDPVFLADTSGAVIEVNERATDYYGYTREELLKMNVSQFRAPGSDPEFERAEKILQKEKRVVFETAGLRKDGTTFPKELSIRLITVDGIVYRQSIVRDMSERKRAQRQIDRLNRLYAVLSRCGQTIVRAQSESDLFREVAESAVESGGFCIAGIRLFDRTTGQPTVDVRTGVAAGFLNDSAVASTMSQGHSGGESGIFICNDLWKESDLYSDAFRAAAAKHAVRSFLLLPLWRGGRIAGEMRLYSSEPEFFNEEETKLATEVADSLCFALESFERKKKQAAVETELRASRERLELVLDATEEAYWDWYLKSDGVQISTRYDTMLGYAPLELPRGYQVWLSLTHPEDSARLDQGMKSFASSGEDLFTSEFRMRRKSGEYIWVNCRGKVVERTSDGTPFRMVGTLTDITARKMLEEEFRQAQKLESVGRLAGGVAHDFNNLLTVINGYSGLMLGRLSQNAPLRTHLIEIRKAGERAAELTKQLLTFSRKNVSEPRLLSLNEAAAECQTMLGRLTRDNIAFTTAYDAAQDEVVIDPSQVQQILMNLVVNASDAMPSGGKLAVRTANEEVSAADLPKDSDGRPGDYAVLEVEDTGIGMDSNTLQHIFEPFFTTKEVGKGTGLGLSTVYGIVRGCRGFVRVRSTPGLGTTFRIYLPVAAEGILRHSASRRAEPQTAGTSGTVLVVEDEDTVRGFAAETLRAHGYSVLSARGGSDALAQARGHAGPIDVVLTDMVMPGMNGKAIASELRRTRPDIRVVFMSGYAEDNNGTAPNGIDARFLHKPFSPEELISRIGETLEKTAVSRKVLVVEDEEAVRALFAEALGRSHQLVLARNGKEAMQLIQEGLAPDLVITDMVMPDMEGPDVIRELRRRIPGARIIAMSGAFGGRFLKTAELLGADATLVKPIHPEVLDQVIDDVLIKERSS
ncbi:MAG TPA: response regulator, partial [Bryobacteraceae bacterium]|nr:response regulator [Bryobacteraceae bacterium]